MLDVFLEVGVDPAVGRADVIGQTAHAVDVCSAEQEGGRHDEKDHEGQSPVHRAQEEEGGQELEGCRDDSGHGAGEGVGDLRDVAVEAAEHVACVEGFLAEPAALHDLGEVLMAQGVAERYFGLDLDLADDDREEDLRQCAGSEDNDVGHEIALCIMRRYVYQSFADPHVQHCHGNRHCADETDVEDAEPIASGCLPEPAYDVGQVRHDYG